MLEKVHVGLREVLIEAGVAVRSMHLFQKQQARARVKAEETAPAAVVRRQYGKGRVKLLLYSENNQCRSAQRTGSSTGENIIAANHGAMRHSRRCLTVVKRGSGQSRDQKHEMAGMPFLWPSEVMLPLSDDSGETRARFRIHWAVKEELVNVMAYLSCGVQYYQGRPTLRSGATAFSHARPRSRAVSAPYPSPEHMTTRSRP